MKAYVILRKSTHHDSYYDDNVYYKHKILGVYADESGRSKDEAIAFVDEFNERPRRQDVLNEKQREFSDNLTIDITECPPFTVPRPVFDKERKYDEIYKAEFQLQMMVFKKARSEYEKLVVAPYDRRVVELRSDAIRKYMRSLQGSPEIAKISREDEVELVVEEIDIEYSPYTNLKFEDIR